MPCFLKYQGFKLPCTRFDRIMICYKSVWILGTVLTLSTFEYKREQIEQLERDLEKFSKKAVPFATRFYLNGIAFEARKQWQQQIDRKMIQRNKFTRNSIRVERVTGLNMRTMHSVVGSIAPYMDDQEFGGTKLPKSGEHVAIATGASANQEGQKPRTKLPIPSNRMRKIRLSGRSIKASNRRQRNAIAIRQAKASGNKFVYLETARNKGIFRITGARANSKLKMIHDLTRRSVAIKPLPTLAPAVTATRAVAPDMAINALQQQVERQKIFRQR